MRIIFLILTAVFVQIQFSDAFSAANIFFLNQQGKDKSVSTSVLASGKWVKLRIKKDGIYKLTYSDIVALGFQQPDKISLYGNGGGMLSQLNSEKRQDDLLQNSISYVDSDSNQVFNEGDYILFYCQGPDKWKYDNILNSYTHIKHRYSEYSYYFITDYYPVNPVISDTLLPQSQVKVSFFDDMQFYEIDNTNLIKSGSAWVGERFDVITEFNKSFYFPFLRTSNQVRINTSLMARSPNSSPGSKFLLMTDTTLINTITIPVVNMNSTTSKYASEMKSSSVFSSMNDSINIKLKFQKSASSSIGWLNYLELIARRNMIFSSGQMQMRNAQNTGAGKITTFSMKHNGVAPVLWDVSNPGSIKRIKNELITADSMVFTVKTDSLKTFIAFTLGSEYTPEIVGEITNQDLHSLPQSEMLIVSHPEFLSQAESLADIHRQEDGLSVSVASIDEIYNEFSSGSPDVVAIRDFVRMFYLRSDGSNGPRYLLLFGDGSYDNKSTVAPNTNFIPTYQSSNSLDPTVSYVSDDFFALLDSAEGTVVGTEKLDIGVGRFPVTNVDEAQLMIDKVAVYYSESSKGSWKRNICLIADDEDSGQYMSQTDGIAKKIDTVYTDYQVEKIYLDAFQQVSTAVGDRYPDVNEAINSAIKNGTLVMNYTGHGNELGLAHEHIVTTTDMASWNNWEKLTFFITASCEFSRFDDYSRVSAGEKLLLSENGGAIALFSTSRLVYATPNAQLNQSIYDFLLKKENGRLKYRLGDVMRLAKNAQGGTGINKRNFTLLGDPALRLACPQESVVADSVFSICDNLISDTLYKYSEVNVYASVLNASGALDVSYNDTVEVVIYDKKTAAQNLQNDAGTPLFNFDIEKYKIAHGWSRAVNGKVNARFYVPADIQYGAGKGKIYFYASNSETEAFGSYKSFIVSSETQSCYNNDFTGPDISAYINSTAFMQGDTVDPISFLIANISDSSGVNNSGNFPWHSIKMILDGSTFYLDNYFITNSNSNKSGSLVFNLPELSAGPHILKLRAWDIYNNTTEIVLNFYVSALISSKEDYTYKTGEITISNPNQNYVQIFNLNEKYSYEILSLEGRKILSGESAEPVLNIEDLYNGAYILIINTSDLRILKKLIKF